MSLLRRSSLPARPACPKCYGGQEPLRRRQATKAGQSRFVEGGFSQLLGMCLAVGQPSRLPSPFSVALRKESLGLRRVKVYGGQVSIRNYEWKMTANYRKKLS